MDTKPMKAAPVVSPVLFHAAFLKSLPKRFSRSDELAGALGPCLPGSKKIARGFEP